MVGASEQGVRGNSELPWTRGAVEQGDSSRLVGCHGIWTQHDGPHLSGGKQQ